MMKILILVLLSVITQLSWAEEVTVNSKAQLPTAVLQALVTLCAPCSFADFGAPWNATDVIANDLPQRRLTHAELSGSEWIIEYEHGGRGKHTHAATFATVPTVHFVGGSCGSSTKCEW